MVGISSLIRDTKLGNFFCCANNTIVCHASSLAVDTQACLLIAGTYVFNYACLQAIVNNNATYVCSKAAVTYLKKYLKSSTHVHIYAMSL